MSVEYIIIEGVVAFGTVSTSDDSKVATPSDNKNNSGGIDTNSSATNKSKIIKWDDEK